MNTYRRVCPDGCGKGVHKIGTDFFRVDGEMVSSDRFICNACGKRTTTFEWSEDGGKTWKRK